MAVSKCGRCECKSFEMVQQDAVAGSRFKLQFVQCAGCGAVVGVTTYEHVPSMLNSLSSLVNSLIARIR